MKTKLLKFVRKNYRLEKTTRTKTIRTKTDQKKASITYDVFSVFYKDKPLKHNAEHFTLGDAQTAILFDVCFRFYPYTAYEKISKKIRKRERSQIVWP